MLFQASHLSSTHSAPTHPVSLLLPEVLGAVDTGGSFRDWNSSVNNTFLWLSLNLTLTLTKRRFLTKGSHRHHRHLSRPEFWKLRSGRGQGFLGRGAEGVQPCCAALQEHFSLGPAVLMVPLGKARLLGSPGAVTVSVKDWSWGPRGCELGIMGLQDSPPNEPVLGSEPGRFQKAPAPHFQDPLPFTDREFDPVGTITEITAA